MTEKDAFQFCDQWLPTWTGNQPQKLIQFYAGNAFYKDPSLPQGLKGREEIFPTPKGFTLKWLAEIPSSDGFLKIEGLDIVEFNEQNKITRNEVYFDPSPLTRLGR